MATRIFYIKRRLINQEEFVFPVIWKEHVHRIFIEVGGLTLRGFGSSLAQIMSAKQFFDTSERRLFLVGHNQCDPSTHNNP
jgi:hypothetical protein